jgi:protein O-mannosyl-transferase
MSSFVKSRVSGTRWDWLTAGVLACITLAVFARAFDCDWVNYDDKDYVTDNAYVSGGLTADNMAWAFTTFHNANWHPLTWLSLQLDATLWGTNPHAFHATNVLVHAANAALLFLALRALTGAFWRSVIVALLFAIHPLRAESVAWVSERKDVLSACFGMAALWAYASYVRRPSRRRYGTVVLALALSLLCKPMLVTLPFLFLVLDWWPLRRINLTSPTPADKLPAEPPGPRPLGNGIQKQARRKNAKPVAAGSIRAATASEPALPAPAMATTAAIAGAARRPSLIWRGLVVEKLPLIALVAASAVVTYVAQKAGGAVGSLAGFPLSIRIENALVSYVAYLGKTVWPVNLSPFYLHPGQEDKPLSLLEPIAAALLLLAITRAAVVLRRRTPYLLTGWLWYLGTLVPVIGLVQVGNQGMADRYTYFPQIGVLLALCWGVADLVRQRYRLFLPVVVAVTLVLAYLTSEQVATWHDSVKLWQHAILATGGTETELLNLGGAMEDQGYVKDAAQNYRDILERYPKSVKALTNLGSLASEEGDQEKAWNLVTQALSIDPDYPLSHTVLGNILYRQGHYPEAKREHEIAIKLQPELHGAWRNLGLVESKLGNTTRAIECYREAIRRKEDFPEAHSMLGNLLISQGDEKGGFAHLQLALRYKPDYPDGHINLGKALAAKTYLDAAVREFEQAIQLVDKETQRLQKAGQLQQSTALNSTLALAWYNLGVAYGAQRRPEQAIDSLRMAIQLDLGEERYRSSLEKYMQYLKSQESDERFRQLERRLH